MAKQSPNQLANLQPNKWKKGQSGNPKGRPKIPDLKELLIKVLTEEKGDMTAAEAIVRAQVIKAIKGDTRAAEVLWERGYGKVKQDIDIETNVIIAPQLIIPPPED